MADGSGSSSKAESERIPKACIFDIGGVVVGSPLVGINRYERDHGLPYNYLNVAITKTGKQGAFQRLERSEVDMYTFYKQFGEELSRAQQLNEWFVAFCKLRGEPVPAALPTSLHVDGRELFGIMMKESTRIDPLIAGAIQRLRQSDRFVVAALTNNFAPPTSVQNDDGSGSSASVPSLEEELKHLGMDKDANAVRSLFHHYIESAKVGKRKPELDFYRHALDVVKAKPEECVFLDDIGINLKAAQSLGIRTIRVSPQSSLPAIRELEKVVKMQLISDQDARKEEQRLEDLLKRRKSHL